MPEPRKHSYPAPDGTSDCIHGCGCWMGPFNDGGPTGVDPFGECPKAPAPGEIEKLSASFADYQILSQFLEWLSSHADLALAEWARVNSKDEPYIEPRLMLLTTISHQAIIYEYLGIDGAGLERERRALLESLRKVGPNA